MGEYYPEVEFAFWVAEVFLVMHAYALCRLPHKVEWNDFWGINYLCTYIPTLPNSPKRSALYIRIFIRIFSASLVIIPPPLSYQPTTPPFAYGFLRLIYMAKQP